jgi:hypothetical protein
MKTRTLQINRTQCVRILLAAILIVIFSYVYMINMISFNTASRESLSQLVSVRQSEIGELENQLLNESKKIDRLNASNFGLVKSVENEAIIVVRNSNTRLTFND